MTYYITARSNDRAKLIHKTATTDDHETAEMVAASWRAQGFDVLENREG